jgi:hypothetical protein
VKAFSLLFKVDKNAPGVKRIAENSLEKEYQVFCLKYYQ